MLLGLVAAGFVALLAAFPAPSADRRPSHEQPVIREQGRPGRPRADPVAAADTARPAFASEAVVVRGVERIFTGAKARP